MHAIILAEGYTDSLRQFEEDFKHRHYANQKAVLRMRELRLYTCSINQCGVKEFMEDVKSLTQGEPVVEFPEKPENFFSWEKATRYVRWLLKPLGLKKYALENVKDSGWRGAVSEGKHNYNAHFVLVGVVDDARNEHGTEQV